MLRAKGDVKGVRGVSAHLGAVEGRRAVRVPLRTYRVDRVRVRLRKGAEQTPNARGSVERANRREGGRQRHTRERRTRANTHTHTLTHARTHTHRARDAVGHAPLRDVGVVRAHVQVPRPGVRAVEVRAAVDGALEEGRGRRAHHRHLRLGGVHGEGRYGGGVDANRLHVRLIPGRRRVRVRAAGGSVAGSNLANKAANKALHHESVTPHERHATGTYTKGSVAGLYNPRKRIGGNIGLRTGARVRRGSGGGFGGELTVKCSEPREPQNPTKSEDYEYQRHLQGGFGGKMEGRWREDGSGRGGQGGGQGRGRGGGE
eukprot:1188744-Prorocentrum_minimum.AAC.3